MIARMSPAFNGSSALQSFEYINTIEICNRIMFDFFSKLSRVLFIQNCIIQNVHVAKMGGGCVLTHQQCTCSTSCPECFSYQTPCHMFKNKKRRHTVGNWHYPVCLSNFAVMFAQLIVSVSESAVGTKT